MELTRRDLAGGAIVLLTVIVSVAAYPELPERLAIHFDAAGEPDSFVSKPIGLVAMPALAAGLAVLFRVLPAIDPLGENVAGFQRYYDLVAVVAVGVVAYVHVLVVVWNLGYDVPITQALAPVLAVLYYVVGAVVENAERNWFVGIRTPWTLSNEEVWNRTHDRTAVLFKLAGIVALLAIPFPEQFLAFAVAPVVIVALASTVYSYVVYRRVAGS